MSVGYGGHGQLNPAAPGSAVGSLIFDLTLSESNCARCGNLNSLTGKAAPTAPPLPYTFVGSYDDGSHSTVYFITRDERVYDVRLGDTVDQTYTVDAVENGQLMFTYKPMSVRQSLPIGAGP